jgi:hypothetical protein
VAGVMQKQKGIKYQIARHREMNIEIERAKSDLRFAKLAFGLQHLDIPDREIWESEEDYIIKLNQLTRQYMLAVWKANKYLPLSMIK